MLWVLWLLWARAHNSHNSQNMLWAAICPESHNTITITVSGVNAIDSEIARAEDSLIELDLPRLPRPRGHGLAAAVDRSAVHARVVRRLEHRALRLARPVEHALRPAGQVAAPVRRPCGREAVDDCAALVGCRPGKGAVQRRLAEEEAVARLQRGLHHAARERLVRQVRERGRHRKVRLVAARHGAKAACALRRRAQLHAHRQQLVAHLAVPALVRERPGGLAGLGDCAAVQRVPLAAPLLRDQQRRVVEPVTDAHELVESPRDGGVRQKLAEGLSVRRPPAEHAAHVEAPRRAVACQLGRLAAVEPRRPQLAGALV
mmetsp:Transcript_22050/g.73147  ORF Transcript_22050/g.73147 Transcript_22050/m.73147 type:complete len:317 (-) Transcript_22050:306-1256(-)